MKLNRKITRAAGKPSIHLPEEIVKQAGLKISQEVSVYLADKKRIVIEATQDSHDRARLVTDLEAFIPW